MEFNSSSPLQVFMNQHRSTRSSLEEGSRFALLFNFKATSNKKDRLFREGRQDKKSSFGVQGKLNLIDFATQFI